MRLKPVDAVVVGVGVAGSILCKELAIAGLEVVGLERGRPIDPQQDFAMPFVHDELKYDGQHSDLLQNLARETITFRNSPDQMALPMREMGSFKPGECVGGAGVHWGGSTFRFMPWDFETRSRTEARYGGELFPEDCTSQDWGVTYEELEPYYDYFEQLYGIGGKAGNLNGKLQEGGSPFEGQRSREYPNPPTPPSHAGALFEAAARSLGYKPFPTPSASITQQYTNPYRQTMGRCVRGGFCSSQGCSMGAKGTPLTAVMPALAEHANFELRTHANVLRVNLDSSGKRATGVTYADALGREVEQPAELVILCSYTFNNTRLLLLSGIGKPYDPATGQGVVGRNYAYSAAGGKVTLFFEDRQFNSFMGGGAQGISMDEWTADHFDHTGLGFVGGGYLSVLSSGALPIGSQRVPPGTPRWGSAWKKAAAHYYDRNFAITTHGSCQAYRTRYLDLDPTYRDAWGQPLARLTFDWHDNERRMAKFVSEKSVEIARSMGPSKISVTAVSGKYSIVPYQSTHNTGGAIMGADPATSVVNRYLQSWDVPNVFVVGGSAFPQNSAKQPTGTIGALACWAAAAITDQYTARPGPLA